VSACVCACTGHARTYVFCLPDISSCPCLHACMCVVNLPDACHQAPNPRRSRVHSILSVCLHSMPINTFDEVRVLPGGGSPEDRYHGEECRNAPEDFHAYHHLHGFFIRPDHFDVADSLVPIFSASKIRRSVRPFGLRPQAS
jgi:hypothetical protein